MKQLEEDSSDPVSKDSYQSLKTQEPSSRQRITQTPFANQMEVGLLLSDSGGMGTLWSPRGSLRASGGSTVLGLKPTSLQVGLGGRTEAQHRGGEGLPTGS